MEETSEEIRAATIKERGWTEEEYDRKFNAWLEWRLLIGTQIEVPMKEEWKEHIWFCPSCKYWFPIDWNHDDQVCCACAGCTKHPFLKCMVECQCERCKGKTKDGMATGG